MKGRGGVFCKAHDFEDAKSIYDSARSKMVLRSWGEGSLRYQYWLRVSVTSVYISLLFITCHFRHNFNTVFLKFTTTVWVCMNRRQWFPARYSMFESKTGPKWMVCWWGGYLFISAIPTRVLMLREYLPWCKDGKRTQIFWGSRQVPIQLLIKIL